MTAYVVGTRKAVTYVDSIEVTDAISNSRIDSRESESDFVSYADAAAGGAREYVHGFTLRQDVAADSLHDYIWSQTGTDVEIVFWPNGEPVGSTPTVSQPSYTGTATITEPDGTLVGGEANKSNTAVQTNEVEWVYTAKPTKATA